MTRGRKQVNNAIGETQLGNPQYKLSQGMGILVKKYGVIEQEIPGMMKEIPKDEAYNYYGDDARKVEIDALGDHWACIVVLSKDVHRDGVRVKGRYAYIMGRKPLKSGHTGTDAYVGDL